MTQLSIWLWSLWKRIPLWGSQELTSYPHSLSIIWKGLDSIKTMMTLLYLIQMEERLSKEQEFCLMLTSHSFWHSMRFKNCCWEEESNQNKNSMLFRLLSFPKYSLQELECQILGNFYKRQKRIGLQTPKHMILWEMRYLYLGIRLSHQLKRNYWSSDYRQEIFWTNNNNLEVRAQTLVQLSLQTLSSN